MSTDNNLWMGDIKPWMDESFILGSFNYYNINPLSVKLIHDRNTNQLKNFCFINFENVEEANRCLIMLNGKQIPNNKNIQIKFKLNWANYFSSFNKSVYVGNLSPDVDDISLYNLFKEKYSSVHHASVITDKGKSKGYGFILFRGEKDYEKCLNEMNGITFHGNKIKVSEQRKKDDDIKTNNFNFNSNENNENNIYNFNNSINNSHHRQSKKNNNNNINNNEQSSLNNIYNLNKINKIKFINSQLSNNINNRSNINNYHTDTNSYMNQNNNNNNNQNIINNIININNINKINNINYINDINNIYNKTHIINNNNNNLNVNKGLNNSSNNSINRNMLDMPNQPSLYSNNNYSKDNNENEANIINNNNQIMNNINNINNNYNKNSKKDKTPDYKLEIFNKYDNASLKKKINENLGKMYNYYMEIYRGDINKLRCKLYFINYLIILF